jgi:hypothetical protein
MFGVETAVPSQKPTGAGGGRSPPHLHPWVFGRETAALTERSILNVPAGYIPGLGSTEKPGRVLSGLDPPDFNLELNGGVVEGADSTATYRLAAHGPSIRIASGSTGQASQRAAIFQRDPEVVVWQSDFFKGIGQPLFNGFLAKWFVCQAVVSMVCWQPLFKRMVQHFVQRVPKIFVQVVCWRPGAPRPNKHTL